MRLSQVFAAVAVFAAAGASAQTVNLSALGQTSTVLSQASFDGGSNFYGVGAVEYHVNDGANSFAAFCLEPAQHYFKVNPTAFTKGSLDAGRAAELSKLFTGAGWNGYAYGTDSVTTASQAAGLGLAVWDIMLDGKLDFTSGSFVVKSDAQTSFAMSAYTKGNTGDAKYVFALQNADYQDLVSAVPEPSTYAMLLAGLAGVGFIARRRQRA